MFIVLVIDTVYQIIHVGLFVLRNKPTRYQVAFRIFIKVIVHLPSCFLLFSIQENIINLFFIIEHLRVLRYILLDINRIEIAIFKKRLYVIDQRMHIFYKINTWTYIIVHKCKCMA